MLIMLICTIFLSQDVLAGEENEGHLGEEEIALSSDRDRYAYGDEYQGKVNKTVKKDHSDIHTSLSYGLDGYAVAERGCGITVSVTSDVDFEGSLYVQAFYSENYGSQNMKHTKNIELKTGETGEYTFYIGNIGSGELTVDICDNEQRTVYSETDRIGLMGNDGYASVVFVGDRAENYHYIRDAKLQTKEGMISLSSCVIEASGIPESVIGLDAADYFVIDRKSLDNITDAARNSVIKWLYGGGSLVVTGVDETELKNEKNSYNLQAYELKDYCIYSMNAGTGVVIAAPVGLSIASIKDEDMAVELIERICMAGYTERIANNSQGYYYNGQENCGYVTAMNQNKKKTPSPYGILLVLLIYTVLAGPVTYIFLKKKNKREYFWIALPVWSVAATFVIYLVGLGVHVKKPMNMSFVAADISGDVVYENTYTHLLGAKASEYSFTVNRDYESIESDGEYMYDSFSAFSDIILNKEVKDDNITLSFNTGRAFQSVDLASTCLKENDIGHITDNIVLQTDGLSGSITNETDYMISDVVVMSDKYYYVIEHIRPQETVTLNKNSCFKRSGDYSDEMSQYYGDTYDLKNDTTSAAVRARNEYMVECMYLAGNSDIHRGVVSIWGTIMKQPEIIVNSDTEDYSCYTVYTMNTHTYDDVEGVYYRDIYALDIRSRYETDYDERTHMMYSDEVTVTARFDEEVYIKELRLDGQPYESSDSLVFIEALNCQTGQYEQVFTNSNRLSGSNLASYMDDGYITFRFISPRQGDYYEEAYLPEISAVGGTR